MFWIGLLKPMSIGGGGGHPPPGNRVCTTPAWDLKPLQTPLLCPNDNSCIRFCYCSNQNIPTVLTLFLNVKSEGTRVWIGHQYPFVVKDNPSNESENSEVSCHYRFGTIKTPSRTKTTEAEQRPSFCRKSRYDWHGIELDEKQNTNIFLINYTGLNSFVHLRNIHWRKYHFLFSNSGVLGVKWIKLEKKELVLNLV